MPNHVTNVIHTNNPEVIRALTGGETYDDGSPKVQFARIVPTPVDYLEEGCSHGHPGMFRPGGWAQDPHRNCWYIWNITHWGTKCDAYSTEAIEGGVKFETAWTHPYPVIEALSRAYPDETLHVLYADEDLGSNCGEYWIQDGILTRETELEDPHDFAARLVYGQPYAKLRAEWEQQEAEYLASVTEAPVLPDIPAVVAQTAHEVAEADAAEAGRALSFRAEEKGDDDA